MRLRRSRGPRPKSPDLVTATDDLPRDGLFEQPLSVTTTSLEPEPLDAGELRVTFRVVVRDAAGRRCPDLAVDATITGPHRAATGQATTDLMGAARFRMAGPAGSYRLRVHDVAAGALAWNGSPDELEITVHDA